MELTLTGTAMRAMLSAKQNLSEICKTNPMALWQLAWRGDWSLCGGLRDFRVHWLGRSRPRFGRGGPEWRIANA